MFIAKNFLIKTFSVVLSLSVIVSMLSCAFTVSAAGDELEGSIAQNTVVPAAKATTSGNDLASVGLQESDLTSSANIAGGLTYVPSTTSTYYYAENLPRKSFTVTKGEISSTGVETPVVYRSTIANMEKINDGVVGVSNVNLNNGVTFWQDSEGGKVRKTNVFTDIVFNLGYRYNIEKILVADAVSESMRTTNYSIYASETAENLFSGEPVFSHFENDGKACNLFTTGNQKAQYIAIRIYAVGTQAAADAGTSLYARLTELAIFGSLFAIPALAELETEEESELTAVSVDKEEFKVGETATFTTTNSNEDLEFKGWRNEEGQFVSYEPTYSVYVEQGTEELIYTAVYEFKGELVFKEGFEGTTEVKGISDDISFGTAASFGIEARQGAESSNIFKVVKPNSNWNYLKLKRNGSNPLPNIVLKENTAYKFSYWYYVESVTDPNVPFIINVVTPSFFDHPEKPETTHKDRIGSHRVFGDETGKWIKKDLYFYTYDYPSVHDYIFYCAGPSTTGATFYLDDIKIEEAAEISITSNEDDVELDIPLSKNYVGASYQKEFGVKQITNIGTYTASPTEGKIITKVTLNGEDLTPNSDGTYTIDITEKSDLVIETAAKEGWGKIIVDQKDGTGLLQQVTDNGANYAGKIGESYSFKFITGEKAQPVVTINGEVVTAVDGIYTIDSLKGDATVKIVCQGDEYRGKEGKDAYGNDLTKYVKELYDIPLWEGDIFYHNIVTIYEGRKTARLLYPADDVIAVRSFDLKKEYIWGVDYDVDDDGNLVILEGNSFPTYTGDVDVSKPGKVSDNGYMQQFGISVTYTHSRVHADGYQKQKVESKLEDLPLFYEKLKNKEDIEFVFYGASSTVGWSSSGLDEYVDWTVTNADGSTTPSKGWNCIGIDPFVPTWARQTVAKLRTEWGYDEEGCETDIKFVNRSSGGRKASDAIKEPTIQAQLGDTNPDVVVLGFSGNDGTDPEFINNIEKIILWIRANLNENCEIIVASSSLPIASTTSGFNTTALSRIPEFEALTQEYEGQGVIYAPTLYFSSIAFKGLTGCDFVANNLNHNNDFGARAFTSVMSGLLANPEHVCKYNKTVVEQDYLASEANCTAAAKYYYSCSCGSKGTTTFSYGELNLNVHSDIYENKEDIPATCHTKAIKSVIQYKCCGKIEGTIDTEGNFDSQNHDGAIKLVNESESSHTATGYTGDRYCVSCNELISSGETIDALGHTDAIYHKEVPATCTTEGETQHYYCPTCDKNYESAAWDSAEIEGDCVIPATGHNTAIEVPEKKATCKNSGNVKYYDCPLCMNYFESRDADAKVIEDVAEAINPNNHEGTLTTLPAKAATCTTTGLTAGKKYSCCGLVTVKQNKTNALGHSYGAYSVTKKATTSANGTLTKKCTRSGCTATSSTTIYKIKTIKLSTTEYTYNGKAKKPSVTIKDSKGSKISSSYYTVSYAKGRKNVGKYKVTIKFKTRYSGTKNLYFTINPKKTSVKSISAGSKKLTVKWSKQKSQATGYEIQYSTSSKFTSKTTKKVTVKSYKTTSKTIKKLKAKKKYYVRIRTYKTVSGKKYYSAWSSKKYKTTKK